MSKIYYFEEKRGFSTWSDLNESRIQKASFQMKNQFSYQKNSFESDDKL